MENMLYPTPPEQHKDRVNQLEITLSSQNLPQHGLSDTEKHLEQIKNAIPRQAEPAYFGFVTGGVTPAAYLADNIVTELDANIHAHFPGVSIATTVEDTALKWLLQLFELDPTVWKHRIVTTGATASNVIGLACGRDFVIREAGKKKGIENLSVAEHGLAYCLNELGIKGIQVLTSMPHSSLTKAASIVGLGRGSVFDISDPTRKPCLDVAHLRQAMSDNRYLYIVGISCGEVNTGRFATDGETMQQVRALCDEYHAWLHVDGAFGLQARILDQQQYPTLHEKVRNIELADSIAGDAHKMLNVPYDCGFFFSRHLDVAVEVFQNNAAYLSKPQFGTLMSPLHIGIENSRRFRALPLYASLRSLGRAGYVDILQRQISTARKIADWIQHDDAYELLPIPDSYYNTGSSSELANAILENIFIVVMFRARNLDFNKRLVELINATKCVYVSGTQWDGIPAVRVAVANWKVDPERESKTVVDILKDIWIQWNSTGRSNV